MHFLTLKMKTYFYHVNQQLKLGCEQMLGILISFRVLAHPKTFFLNYPPSSGIASCVGTAGTVHDAYT